MDRVSTSNSLLGRLKTDLFLNRLVTGDEKWIQYDNVCNGNELGNRGINAINLPKAGLHPQKVILSIWWGCKRVIFFELLPVGETINSNKYCQQLYNLKAVIDEKCPILANRKGVVFHHDNARLQRSHFNANATQTRELNWDLLLHPPYSPDIASSDYHLFQSLENNLNGKKFALFHNLKNYVSLFFNERPTTFYDRGIRMLPERWRKIVENNGDYLIK